MGTYLSCLTETFRVGTDNMCLCWDRGRCVSDGLLPGVHH